MSRRRGEISPAQVDAGWPYQVALPSDKCHFKNHDAHRAFNADRSICAYGHSVVFQDIWYTVFCYGDKTDAEAFMEAFGGEWFDPRERGRGAKWAQWNRGKFTPPGEFPKPAPKKGWRG